MRCEFSWNLRPKTIIRTASIFLLAGTLSACDFSWHADQETQANRSLSEAKSSPKNSVDDALLLNADHQAVDGLLALNRAPEPEPADRIEPIPSDVELTPLESAGHPEGNAELAVRYENAEALGEAVDFVIDKRKYVLKRDAKDPRRFASLVDFDFDLFVEEQENRRQQIVKERATEFPVFDGRALVGESKFEFIDPEFLRTARERSLPISIRQSLIALPLPLVRSPAKTLVVTDLSVVQDPTRTFDICGNVGNPDGAWTFKTLMTEMANESATGVDPADFVEHWLQSWNVSHTINTFPVPARTNINARVLNPWPRDANGRLDLAQSPMRLLAVVNRLDLRNSSTGVSSYGGSGGIPIDAGEGRFVFGVVDRNNNGGCSKMEFTVILEYKVPINQCTAIRSYAQQWLGLGNITLGSAAFNPALQAITDQFTLAGAGGTKPNGSAISQIRTNEIALVGYGNIPIDLDPSAAVPLQTRAAPQGGPWELREFHLQADNLLHIVSTKNTPHHTRNNTALLANYINAHQTSIIAGTHNVLPIWSSQRILTGSTINTSVADNVVWKAPGIASTEARHKFSLNTCNSCHGGETRYNGKPVVSFPTPETSFVHITPRDFNVQSDLSKFLIGTGTLAAPSTFQKGDPVMPTTSYTIRPFGDVLRRQGDLASMSVHSCAATALLQEVMFRRMAERH